MLMTEKRNSPRKKAARRPKETFAAEFNKRSRKISEVELKFIVPGNDRKVFNKLEKYFSDLGWIKLSRKNSHLVTLQLHTPEKKLLKDGTTLRIRGNCLNDRLDDISDSDICLKTGATLDQSGAVRRGEYEARTTSFDAIQFTKLLQKYPKAEYPELYDALNGVKASDLQEYFRIDCYRNRYIVEIPEDVTGIKGKRFVCELIMDDVAFVMDIPGLETPLIFHHDLEVECETLFKPCSYDSDPHAQKYFSSPMNQKEANDAMSVIKNHMIKGGKNKLLASTNSKAERGFMHFDIAIDALQDYVVANNKQTKGNTTKLSSAFTLSAKSAPAGKKGNVVKLHKRLPRKMGYVLRERAIALGG